MYDLLTSAMVFVLLTPGLLLSLPSSTHGDPITALVHAIVFWIVLRYISGYIPWWTIWVAAIATVGYKLSNSSSGT
jgi:ABC-type uncharacterized transport system permease subunit